MPSVVEFATGRVRSSVNLHLADFDLRGALQERLGLPVFVDNDATVAALAEAFDESGRPVVQNLVMFTVGTGIGGGLVLGGKVYRGTTGAAGELGHTLVGADFGQGVPRPLSFRSAAHWSRWPPAGSWTTWRRDRRRQPLLGAGEAGGGGQGGRRPRRGQGGEGR